MKFEKINKDKIKVILNNEDLNSKDIDFVSFMSDSNQTHSLFLDVLETAERDYGFITENYNLKVETVALANGNFILTITRILDTNTNTNTNTSSNTKKKPSIRRKIPKLTNNSSVIYKFNSFDDFCDFVLTLNQEKTISYKNFSKDTVLYSYHNQYYLILKDINVKFVNFKSLFALLSEFSCYCNSSDIFIAKLHESGSIVFKSKAIQKCMKYFV